MHIDDRIHDGSDRTERDFWRDEPTRRLPRVARTTADRPRRHGDTPAHGTPLVGRPLVPSVPRAERGADPTPSGRLRLVPAQLEAFDPFGDEPVATPTGRLAVTLGDDEVEVDRIPTGELALVASVPAGRHRPFAVRIGVMLALGMVAIALSWAVRDASADGPAPTPSPASVASQPGPSRVTHRGSSQGRTCANGTYTVGRGDGWIAIAKKLGVTTKQLLAANKATAKTVIHPGGTICLPAGATAPAATAPAAAPSTKGGTTTPKPPATPAPAASTTVVTKTYSAAEVEAIIRQVWPDELEDEALRIATRESNLKPSAKNSCCYGLFQLYFSVHKSWLAGLGVTSASQLLDPTVNANAAYALYQRAGGFGPWT